MAFRQPQGVVDVFSTQLTPAAWAAAAASMAAVAATSAASWKWSGRKGSSFSAIDTAMCKFQAPSLHFPNAKRFFVIRWPLSALAQQGHDPSPPPGPSHRLVFLTGFAFALVLFDYFTANIISTLQTAASIGSVGELVDRHPEIRLLFPDPADESAAPWFDVLKHSRGRNVRNMVKRLECGGNAGFIRELEDGSVEGLAGGVLGDGVPAAFLVPDNSLFNPAKAFSAGGCNLDYKKLTATMTNMAYPLRKTISNKVENTSFKVTRI